MRAMIAAAPVAFILAVALVVPAPSGAQPAAPSSVDTATPLDRDYDGNLHVEAGPFVWLPTIDGSLQFTVPALPPAHAPGPLPPGVLPSGSTAHLNVSAGPNGYLSTLNSALMATLGVRKGDVAGFAEFTYTNASTGATAVTSVAGPGGITFPANLGSDGRLVSTLWLAGIAKTLARGHAADLQFFEGYRNMNARVTLNYNVNLGPGGIVSKSGSVTSSETLDDAIFGLRGTVYPAGSHLFIPYTVDYGTGSNNQAWHFVVGTGYRLSSGTVTLAWRSLHYFDAPSSALVQNLRLEGPLLEYHASF